MKQIITALLIIVLTVSLIAVTFTINQVNSEKQRLAVDLQHRSTLLAESFRETIEPNFINKSDEYLQTIVEKFADRERFAGMAVYDHRGNISAMSSNLRKEIIQAQQIATDAMDEDKANGGFVEFEDEETYLLAIPLHDKKSIVGALMVAQNAGYIDNRLTEIWQNSLIRLFLQIFFLQ